MTVAGGGDLGSTRQKVIDALCEHFANDALSVDEFERRVDQAHKAESLDEIKKLLADMPSGDLPVRQEDVPGAAIQRPQASIPATRVKERAFMLAVLGGVERKGRWIPARQNYSFSVMGGMVLDFREALLPPGETEVWVFAAMGGVEIVVPPGLPVECDGFALLGGFDYGEEAMVAPDPDTPLLRVRGFCLMGGVEVTTRHPGETAREAKRRRKFEKKKRKLERKQLGDGS